MAASRTKPTLTLFQDGDFVGYFDLSVPAQKERYEVLMKIIKQRTPSIDQLWCFMLEFVDLNDSAEEPRFSESAVDPDAYDPSISENFRGFTLDYLLRALHTPNANQLLLSPSNYKHLDRAKAFFRKDLGYYLEDLDKALDRLTSDIKHPSISNNRIEPKSLLLVIALVLNDKEKALAVIHKYNINSERLPLPMNSVVGGGIFMRLLGFTKPAWNGYKHDDLMEAAENGYDEMMADICAQGNVDINLRNLAALYKAILFGHERCVKFLLDRAETKVDSKLLFAAGRSYAITDDKENAARLKTLIERKMSINYDKERDTPLYTAAGKGDVVEVKRLLSNGAVVKPGHFFAAGWASNKHGTEIAQELLNVLAQFHRAAMLTHPRQHGTQGRIPSVR